MHMAKTKILTEDKNIVEAAEEVGVEAVKSFKYLGVEICISKENTIKAAVKRCTRYSNGSLA